MNNLILKSDLIFSLHMALFPAESDSTTHTTAGATVAEC